MAQPTNTIRSSGNCRGGAGAAFGLIAVGVTVAWLTAHLAAPLSIVPAASAAAPGPVLPEEISTDTQAMIEKGLNYLIQTQRPDGSWTASSNYRGYSTVMTSMAGMALLANGSTPEEGPYARNVTRAMDYVLSNARPQDGLIGAPGSGRSMYSHGFSMLFLAQCYGVDISDDYSKTIHAVLTKAVALTAKVQSDLGDDKKNAGGWYYSPESRSDEGSVTVTQLQALRAARNVGIKVPTRTIERAVAYLRYCQQPDGGICYSASSRGSSRPAISAAALACFYAAGIYDRKAGGAGGEARMVEALWNYVRPHCDPARGSNMYGHYYYMHFYYAQAQYQQGGKEWRRYYDTMARIMTDTQNLDGSWTGGVGPIFDTSVACIILQLPYGYLPISQK